MSAAARRRYVAFVKLAIYCLAWGSGAEPDRELTVQRELGRGYAGRTPRPGRDWLVYQDRLDAIDPAPRPCYERLKEDISRGEIGEVWARDVTVLHPFFDDEQKNFVALCRSKGVRVSFEMR